MRRSSTQASCSGPSASSPNGVPGSDSEWPPSRSRNLRSSAPHPDPRFNTSTGAASAQAAAAVSAPSSAARGTSSSRSRCTAARASAQWSPCTASASLCSRPYASTHDHDARAGMGRCSSWVRARPAWISRYSRPGCPSHSCQWSPPGLLPHRNSLRPRSRSVEVCTSPVPLPSRAAIQRRWSSCDREEVVGGLGRAGGVRAVLSVEDGDRHASQRALVGELPGLVCGGQDAYVVRLGYRDVGPPVHRRLDVVGVDDADVDEEHGGALGQPGVDLEHDLTQPFELVHPQHGRAVRLQHPDRVQRLARRGGVTDGPDVPLHATGEPGVPQGEVRRLEDRVPVQQLATGGLVHQRPQPAAEAEEEGGPQDVVLQHGDRVLGRPAVAAVTVLDQIGQHRADPAVPDVVSHLRVGLAGVDDRVQVSGGEQRRQRVDGTDVRRRHGQRLETQLAHRLIEMAATSWFPR